MTSSDVLDTAFAVQLTRAADLIIDDVQELLSVLRRRALEHKDTICIGRSHGVHAEPTTFGLKLAQAYAEFDRNLNRLRSARDEIATCAVSGAVGTYAHLGTAVERYVAKNLRLRVEPVSTQVIPRDRHAMFFATLGVVASSIERLATEVRHLQRTEVREVEEPFSSGQKGSSAMPHKRNPILAENLTGLARMVRSAVIPAMENVVLWHERDISHSSVERMIAPDATVTLDFALTRLTALVADLRVLPEMMSRNLTLLDGLVDSQRVMLALTQKGAEREQAYELVQRSAMAVWEDIAKANAQHSIDEVKEERQRNFRQPKNLRTRLSEDHEIREYLSEDELTELFDYSYHLTHVDEIYDRVFGVSWREDIKDLAAEREIGSERPREERSKPKIDTRQDQKTSQNRFAFKVA
jgi:adenylosuccinate lyase